MGEGGALTAQLWNTGDGDMEKKVLLEELATGY